MVITMAKNFIDPELQEDLKKKTSTVEELLKGMKKTLNDDSSNNKINAEDKSRIIKAIDKLSEPLRWLKMAVSVSYEE